MAVKGYKKELKKSVDAVYGTLGWIEPRVSPDVFAKIQTAMRMSFNVGVLTIILEQENFRDGLEDELSEG